MPLELGIFGFVDNSHSAAPYDFKDPVFSGQERLGSQLLHRPQDVRVCEKTMRSAAWTGVPHLLQKRESSEISVWHRGHFMARLPLFRLDYKIISSGEIVNSGQRKA